MERKRKEEDESTSDDGKKQISKKQRDKKSPEKKEDSPEQPQNTGFWDIPQQTRTILSETASDTQYRPQEEVPGTSDIIQKKQREESEIKSTVPRSKKDKKKHPSQPQQEQSASSPSQPQQPKPMTQPIQEKDTEKKFKRDKKKRPSGEEMHPSQPQQEQSASGPSQLQQVQTAWGPTQAQQPKPITQPIQEKDTEKKFKRDKKKRPSGEEMHPSQPQQEQSASGPSQLQQVQTAWGPTQAQQPKPMTQPIQEKDTEKKFKRDKKKRPSGEEMHPSQPQQEQSASGPSQLQQVQTAWGPTQAQQPKPMTQPIQEKDTEKKFKRDKKKRPSGEEMHPSQPQQEKSASGPSQLQQVQTAWGPTQAQQPKPMIQPIQEKDTEKKFKRDKKKRPSGEEMHPSQPQQEQSASGPSQPQQVQTAWGPTQAQQPKPMTQPIQEKDTEKKFKKDKKKRPSGEEMHPSQPQQEQSAWGSSKPQQPQTALGPSQPQRAQTTWGPSQPQQVQAAWGPSKPQQPQTALGPSQPQRAQTTWGPSQPQQVQAAWGPSKPQQPQTALGPSQPQQPQSAWSRSAPQEAGGTWIRRPEPEMQRPGTSAGHERDSSKKERPMGSEAKLRDPPSPEYGPSGVKQARGAQKDKTEDFWGKETIKFAPKIIAPTKPGRRIIVETNHFALKIANPNIIIYHYDVVFQPESPKSLYRTAWNKFCESEFKNRVTVFDGKKNAFSKGPLIGQSSYSGKVSVYNPDSEREREFCITIQEVRKADLSFFANYHENINKTMSLPQAELTIIDIILRNEASDLLIHSGKAFFPRMSSRPRILNLSDRLVLRNGHFQSAVIGSQLYLNFDIAQKAFYRSGRFLDILESFHDRQRRLDLDALNHFIKGMKIRYQLPGSPDSSRIYSVNKTVESANRMTFEKEDGSKITVEAYLAREKNYRLKYPDLPLLWVGSMNKTIYVPMELCSIDGEQVYKGEMDPNETREMVRSATQNARMRKDSTMWARQQVNYDNRYTREFGLSVSGQMERVEARVLSPPTLIASRPIKVAEGVWRSRDLLDPKSLDKWCILNLDRYAKKDELDNFQRIIQAKGREFNMRIGPPSKSTIMGDAHPVQLQKTLDSLSDMDLVFVIISDEKGVYSRVKTICETQKSILTQCLKTRTVKQDPRKISTTIENILLKVNAKLGGRNHTIEKSSMPPCLKGLVMIVGADVTHSGPGSKIPSVAAVAVSCDPSAFQYGISTRVQVGEIILDMGEIIYFHLKNFRRLRGEFPEKIIFFRDGVSEGELPKMFDTELRAIKRACSQVGIAQTVRITMIVVQKRHHTRFYPVSTQDETGKNYNVPVGTCVDSGIVHPRDLDFYLVSHASILGTARPTRYRLLYDDSRLTDNELEQLTFYLCHMYSRCNRSVSYPSPTYNAHLAAFRVRSYLESLKITKADDLSKVQGKLRDTISSNYPMFFV